jgi:hypothetical protein
MAEKWLIRGVGLKGTLDPLVVDAASEEDALKIARDRGYQAARVDPINREPGSTVIPYALAVEKVPDFAFLAVVSIVLYVASAFHILASVFDTNSSGPSGQHFFYGVAGLVLASMASAVRWSARRIGAQYPQVVPPTSPGRS